MMSISCVGPSPLGFASKTSMSADSDMSRLKTFFCNSFGRDIVLNEREALELSQAGLETLFIPPDATTLTLDKERDFGIEFRYGPAFGTRAAKLPQQLQIR